MADVTIRSDVIDDLIATQSRTLDALRSATGRRVDRVTELCQLLGISKQALAAGLIWTRKGDISVSEMAKILQVDRSTIHRWPDIIKALNAR